MSEPIEYPVSFHVEGDDDLAVEVEVTDDDGDHAILLITHAEEGITALAYSLEQIGHLVAAFDCLPPPRFPRFRDTLGHAVALVDEGEGDRS